VGFDLAADLLMSVVPLASATTADFISGFAIAVKFGDCLTAGDATARAKARWSVIDTGKTGSPYSASTVLVSSISGARGGQPDKTKTHGFFAAVTISTALPTTARSSAVVR
jgi:hypothetical protein